MSKDWEMYKVSLIGSISGLAEQAKYSGDHKYALKRIREVIAEYDKELEKRIKESEAKLNG